MAGTPIVLILPHFSLWRLNITGPKSPNAEMTGNRLNKDSFTKSKLLRIA